MSVSGSVLVLRAREVNVVLKSLKQTDIRSLQGYMEAALRTFSTQRDDYKSVFQVLRQSITTDCGTNTLFMPAASNICTTIKIVAVNKTGPPMGAIIVHDPNGSLRGVINAEEITAFRTALASMILFSRRKHVQKLTIFGAGKQAEWHLRLALSLRGAEIKHITFLTRNHMSMQNFLDRVRPELVRWGSQVQFHWISQSQIGPDWEYLVAQAVRFADAIFCCTPSKIPLFKEEWIGASRKSKPRYISLIGSYRPDMHEVEVETIRSADILLVDSRQACLVEAGEIIDAGLEASEITELGQLLAVESGSNTEETELSSMIAQLPESDVVFKCVGMGIMDMVASQGVLQIVEANYGEDFGFRIPEF